MIARSNIYPDDTLIISMASSLDGHIKISIRKAGLRENKKTDLRKTIQSIIYDIDKAISGGHKFAAGALIPQEKEQEFLEKAQKRLPKLIMEEVVK